MAKTLAIAALRMFITVLLAGTFVFVILRVSGDPIRALLPLDAPEELVQSMRAEWGLDQPLPVQFASYVDHLLHGNFGRSMSDGRSAMEIVLEKIPATLLLMGTG